MSTIPSSSISCTHSSREPKSLARYPYSRCGFWIIAKFFNLTVKQTLQTWTVLEAILFVVSFAVAGILLAIFA